MYSHIFNICWYEKKIPDLNLDMNHYLFSSRNIKTDGRQRACVALFENDNVMFN